MPVVLSNDIVTKLTINGYIYIYIYIYINTYLDITYSSDFNV